MMKRYARMLLLALAAATSAHSQKVLMDEEIDRATGTRAQMATARTGPALAKKARRTSHQIETEIANKGTGARPPPTVYRVFIQSVYIAPMLTVP